MCDLPFLCNRILLPLLVICVCTLDVALSIQHNFHPPHKFASAKLTLSRCVTATVLCECIDQLAISVSCSAVEQENLCNLIIHLFCVRRLFSLILVSSHLQEICNSSHLSHLNHLSGTPALFWSRMISALERSSSLLHHSNHHHLSHLNGNNSASNSTGSSSPSPVSTVLNSATSTAASLLLPSGHHLTSSTGQLNHPHHHHHSSHHHAHLNHPAHPAAHLNYSHHHHHLSHLHSALSIASTVLNSSNSSSSSSSGLSVATFGDSNLLTGASSPSPVSVGGHIDTSQRVAGGSRKTDTPVSPASGESVPAPPRRHSSSSPSSVISPGDGAHSPALSGKTTLDISCSSRSAKSLNSAPSNPSIRDSNLTTSICSTGAPASPLTASSAVGSPASTSTSADRPCVTACTIASSVSSASLGLMAGTTTSYPVTGGPNHPHSHHHASLDASAGRLLSSPVSNSAAVASAYTHAAHPFSSSFYHSPYTADTAAAAAAASASYMFAASSAASSSLYPSLVRLSLVTLNDLNNALSFSLSLFTGDVFGYMGVNCRHRTEWLLLIRYIIIVHSLWRSVLCCSSRSRRNGLSSSTQECYTRDHQHTESVAL